MALIDTLGEIPDPRRGNAQRHEPLGILTIALVASVCGAGYRSGSGMNSASSPGGRWKRPCAQSPWRQAAFAASMRS